MRHVRASVVSMRKWILRAREKHCPLLDRYPLLDRKEIGLVVFLQLPIFICFRTSGLGTAVGQKLFDRQLALPHQGLHTLYWHLAFEQVACGNVRRRAHRRNRREG